MPYAPHQTRSRSSYSFLHAKCVCIAVFHSVQQLCSSSCVFQTAIAICTHADVCKRKAIACLGILWGCNVHMNVTSTNMKHRVKANQTGRTTERNHRIQEKRIPQRMTLQQQQASLTVLRTLQNLSQHLQSLKMWIGVSSGDQHFLNSMFSLYQSCIAHMLYNSRTGAHLLVCNPHCISCT